MIILDACILWGCGPESNSADLLRAIRRAGGEEVAVPWMALEELVAQKAVKYQEKHDAVVRAYKALQQATPWEKHWQERPSPETDAVREHWRNIYRGIVGVIPTPERALRDAAFREANGLAPCRIIDKGTRKTGFRDAAIWLSATEYTRTHPNDTVYFVSSNTKDFGDGKSYRDPMASDIGRFGRRFVHLTSIDDVFKMFAKSVDIESPPIRTLLAQVESRATISEAISNLSGDSRRIATFQCTAVGRNGRAVAWLQPPSVELISLRDTGVYRIGEETWYAAAVRWVVYGDALMEVGSFSPAACAWETRVLISPSAERHGLTILRTGPPGRIEGNDGDALPDNHLSHRIIDPAELPVDELIRLERLLAENLYRGGDRSLSQARDTLARAIYAIRPEAVGPMASPHESSDCL